MNLTLYNPFKSSKELTDEYLYDFDKIDKEKFDVDNCTLAEKLWV
jgi:hypothetical protein